MVVTVEELQRLEDTDIRELKRENLDNAGDVTFDKTKPANLRMLEFLEKTRQLLIPGLLRKLWRIR